MFWGEFHGPFPIFTVASLNFGLSGKGFGGAICQCWILFGVEKWFFFILAFSSADFGS
jgi:hypothetical protein